MTHARPPLAGFFFLLPVSSLARTTRPWQRTSTSLLAPIIAAGNVMSNSTLVPTSKSASARMNTPAELRSDVVHFFAIFFPPRIVVASVSGKRLPVLVSATNCLRALRETHPYHLRFISRTLNGD